MNETTIEEKPQKFAANKIHACAYLLDQLEDVDKTLGMVETVGPLEIQIAGERMLSFDSHHDTRTKDCGYFSKMDANALLRDIRVKILLSLEGFGVDISQYVKGNRIRSQGGEDEES